LILFWYGEFSSVQISGFDYNITDYLLFQQITGRARFLTKEEGCPEKAPRQREMDSFITIQRQHPRHAGTLSCLFYCYYFRKKQQEHLEISC
jgi:hypothetical protein